MFKNYCSAGKHYQYKNDLNAASRASTKFVCFFMGRAQLWTPVFLVPCLEIFASSSVCGTCLVRIVTHKTICIKSCVILSPTVIFPTGEIEILRNHSDCAFHCLVVFAGLAGNTPVAVGGTVNTNPDSWAKSTEWSKRRDGSWSDPSFDKSLPSVHGPNAMELSRQVTIATS